MKYNENNVGFLTGAMRLLSLAAAGLLAHGAYAAVWTGGASGTLDYAANWDGDITTSTMVFTNDCTLTLSADATVMHPLTDGNATDVPVGSSVRQNFIGHSVTFDLDGKTLTANENDRQFWRVRNASATFMGGGTVEFVSGSTTNGVYIDNPDHPGMALTIRGAGTKFVGDYVARTRSSTGPGARFSLLDGATAYGNFNFSGWHSTNHVSNGCTLFYGVAANSEYSALGVGRFLDKRDDQGQFDVLRVSGGTVRSQLSATSVHNSSIGVGHGANSYGNQLIVDDGGTVSTPSYLQVGSGSSCSNTLLATGAGTTVSAWHVYLGTLNDTTARNNEIVVADGATFSASSKIVIRGSGNVLVISNATVSTPYHLETSTGTGNTIRFAGANPVLSCLDIGDGKNSLDGAPVVEYVIPEAGWETAPLRVTRAFAIPADVTLRIDMASVKAFFMANPRGGTVPLMKTGDASRAITVADMDALAANLPGGCSLVNESGVLSVNIKPVGFSIFVR